MVAMLDLKSSGCNTRVGSNPTSPITCGYGVIGSRARLRIWCPKGRGGSNPFTRTMLDKAIEHGREHRKQPHGKKYNFPNSCRPHGGCPLCTGNRFHSNHLREVIAEEEMEEFYEEIDRIDYDRSINPGLWS